MGGSSQSFSVEVWFKTFAGAPGGKIIGFGNKQDNSSTAYHEHVYIGSSGKVLFGVNAGGAPYSSLSTAVRVNDGKRRQVVAVLSTTTGSAIYVDGTLVGSNAVKSSQSFTGWWRVGSGTVNGADWPDVPAIGGSGGWFTGTLRHRGVQDGGDEGGRRVRLRSGPGEHVGAVRRLAAQLKSDTDASRSAHCAVSLYS